MISLKRVKLLAAVMFVAGAGWLAANEIRERGALASKQLAMAAKAAMERGEHDLAMLLALEGLPAGKGQVLPMDSLQARFALNEARQKNRLLRVANQESEFSDLVPGEKLFSGREPRVTSRDGSFYVRLHYISTEVREVQMVQHSDNSVLARFGETGGRESYFSLSPDDRFVALVTYDQERVSRLDVWNLSTGARFPQLRDLQPMHAQYFSFVPGEDLLVSVNREEGGLVFWDLKSDTKVDDYLKGDLGFSRLRNVPNGPIVMYRDSDGISNFLEARRVESYRTKVRIVRNWQIGSRSEKFSRIWISEFGSKLVTSSSRGEFKIWDAGDPYVPVRLHGRADVDDETALARVSPDGLFATSWDVGFGLSVWDLTARKKIGSLPFQFDEVGRVLWSPDGNSILTVADDTLRVFDIGSAKQHGNSSVPRLKPVYERRSEDYYSDEIGPAFLDENRFWFMDSHSGSIFLIDLSTDRSQEIEMKFWENTPVADPVSWSSNLILFDAEDRGEFPYVIDMETQDFVQLEAPEAVTDYSHFEYRFVANDEYIEGKSYRSGVSTVWHYWNSETGKLVAVHDLGGNDEIDVDGQGRLLILGETERRFRIGSLKKGGLTEVELSQGKIRNVLSTHKGTRYAFLAMEDGSVVLVDTRNGNFKQQYFGHESPVEAVQVIEGENLLVTSGHDGGIGIWNLETGERVWTARVSPSGYRFNTCIDLDMESYCGPGPSKYGLSGASYPQLSDGVDLIVSERSWYGLQSWNVTYKDAMISRACASLPENRRSLSEQELSEYSLPAAKEGPCDRHGLLSPQFWREKAEGFGLVQ